MNTVDNDVVPKDLKVKVTTSLENDPLGLAWAEFWGLDDLTGILSTRIVALVNTIEAQFYTDMDQGEIKKCTSSISTLSMTIRDIQRWPFINGQSLTFKYDHTYYRVAAIEPRKFEEIERAKNFVSKNSLRATQTGL